jgi:hypothetical protein
LGLLPLPAKRLQQLAYSLSRKALATDFSPVKGVCCTGPTPEGIKGTGCLTSGSKRLIALALRFYVLVGACVVHSFAF